MTKKFSEYQHLSGKRKGRDIKEEHSKFWGKGKWDNFIAPLLPKRCEDMTFVDLGCNAGLFLGFAEDKGFDRVIGLDSDLTAIRKGDEYRREINGNYNLFNASMTRLDLVPLADYVVLVNAHYYLNVSEFTLLLDKLRNRTRFCLVVSGDRKTQAHIASSGKSDLRDYFRDWKEVDGIDEIDGTGDPSPRKLWTLAFQSPTLKRVSMRGLDCGNHVQSSFYKEIDKGIPYSSTKYYKIIKDYRLKKNPESLSVWTKKELEYFFTEKVRIYKDVKERGLMQPIFIDKNGRILDGNHRFMMLKHLGHRTILVREI